MDWNSNAPLKLLENMPSRLTKANLEKIQAVIDNDKLICSTMLGRDLCNEYAPFCVLCDKSMSTPCAVAYIRMKQAEGIKLEIAVSDEEEPEDIVVQSEEEQPEPISEPELKEEPADEPTPKKYIKIATLKRKIDK